MSNTTVHVRVPKELKQSAKNIFSERGMTVSAGIRSYLYQIVENYPLSSSSKLIDSTRGFKEAIDELDSGKAEHFESIDDLVASWK